MCQIVLRPLQPTLHLLEPQRQTAKQPWVGKFTVLFLLAVLAVNFIVGFIYFFCGDLWDRICTSNDFSMWTNLCWLVCSNVVIFWCVALLFADWKALSCVCRTYLIFFWDQGKTCRLIFLWSVTFWMYFIQFKTSSYFSLLSGFGNRCIHPKGPREPPLEWTW